MIRVSVAVLILAATTVAVVPEPVESGHVCDPHPIGRCGDYQREHVTICYVIRSGQYLPPTDTDVTAVGAAAVGAPPTGQPVVDESMMYIRHKPTDVFLDDPYNAPFPFKTLYQESNAVPGLQPDKFKCGTFIWFAECEPAQWMGPSFETTIVGDTHLV